MTRKSIQDVVAGDVLLNYDGKGNYSVAGTFRDYVANTSDPKIHDDLLKFTMKSPTGVDYSRVYSPEAFVVVQ